MKLSSRLEAVAALVKGGVPLADIGTDHAYVPIALVESGKIPSAIAMDINEGPLHRAKEHIAEAGLADKIEVRSSDGLSALKKGEAGCVLLAGMGGALTVRILLNGAGVLSEDTELVLAPQSEVEKVRGYLNGSGWVIEEEDLVEEDGKYYPMMRACRNGEKETAKLGELEAVFGPVLLKERHPVLHRYLIHEEKVLKEILSSLKNGKGSRSEKRSEEVKKSLMLTEEALQLFG